MRRGFPRSVAALGLGLAVAGCGGERPDVEVAHRKDDGPAPPAAVPAGPPPGGLEVAWRANVASRGFRVVGNRVVAVLDDGLEARDLRTGRPSWRFREPGRRLSAVAFSDDAAVATFRGDSAKDPHVVALDAGDGELLWERAERWSLTTGGQDGQIPGRFADVADGVVPVIEDGEDDRRIGVDVRSGEQRWTVDADDLGADECRAGPGSAAGEDGALLPVVVRCDGPPSQGPRRALVATVDAGSGKLAWRRPLSSSPSSLANVEVSGDIAVLRERSDAPPVVLARDGRERFRAEPGTRCAVGCELVGTADAAVFRYRWARPRRGDADRIVVVDRRSDRVRRITDDAPLGTGLAAVGDRVATARIGLTRATAGQLLPQGLLTVDPGRGTTTRSPLPIAGPAQGGRAVAPAEVVGAGDGLLVVSEGRAGTAGERRHAVGAYRAVETSADGPAELGGVAADDWPRACALLAGTSSLLDRRRHRTARVGDPLRIGSTSIREPWCARSSFDVRVVWHAPSVAAAEALLPRRSGAASPAFGADAEAPGRGALRTVRAGRTILTIGAGPGRETAAAAIVVRNARERE